MYTFNKTASKDAFGKRNGHAVKDDYSIIRIPGGVPAIITPEDFGKVRQKMIANKKAPGSYKAKEHYLLTSLIFCGECLNYHGTDYAMMGNSRNCGRNKSRYVTYRCGNRDRTKSCKNPELRREYIENYVLDELQKRIFNDEAIPVLVKKLNEFQIETDDGQQEEKKRLEKTLKDVDREINNIVGAIAKGFTQPAFLTARIAKIQPKQKKTAITEDTL